MSYNITCPDTLLNQDGARAMLPHVTCKIHRIIVKTKHSRIRFKLTKQGDDTMYILCKKNIIFILKKNAF